MWNDPHLMAQESSLAGCAASLVRQGWTQRADARAADGTVVEPWSERAVAWSLLGALVAALERLARDGDAAAVSELASVCVGLAVVVDADSLTFWNDTPGRTQAEVLVALAAAEAGSTDSRFSAN